jgi:hypothetical protein
MVGGGNPKGCGPTGREEAAAERLGRVSCSAARTTWRSGRVVAAMGFCVPLALLAMPSRAMPERRRPSGIHKGIRGVDMIGLRL